MRCGQTSKRFLPHVATCPYLWMNTLLMFASLWVQEVLNMYRNTVVSYEVVQGMVVCHSPSVNTLCRAGGCR